MLSARNSKRERTLKHRGGTGDILIYSAAGIDRGLKSDEQEIVPFSRLLGHRLLRLLPPRPRDDVDPGLSVIGPCALDFSGSSRPLNDRFGVRAVPAGGL